ncbi:Hypp9500 [Branchiostoma lanceolatum]|uniref:Hypp9500 protein n=1 Tax=Branchiostoma lanceolatum TaxID=7740 RepID=A0A8S4MNS5_BRALA|nr:Hypp9500 [Branchiostoma lanceolatum]
MYSDTALQQTELGYGDLWARERDWNRCAISIPEPRSESLGKADDYRVEHIDELNRAVSSVVAVERLAARTPENAESI